MSLNSFIEKIQKNEKVSFQDTIAVITENCHYEPTEFANGLGEEQLINAAGSNEGSCKIFAFAALHKLTQAQTLTLFGDYYWHDVLEHPAAKDHQNIRNFIKYGWEGIRYTGNALTAR